MPDALAQPLQRWHDFYLLVGGAAATLVGLMFVAISLGSRFITQESLPGLRVFVSPTLIHFIYVLVIATVAMIPTLTLVPLGILLVLVGLFSFGRAVSMLPYMRQQHRAQTIDKHDWVWHLIAPSISYLLFVGTGIGLLLRIDRAFDGLALSSILLLVSGIRNAWDLVTWFALKTEDPPH